MYMGCWPGAMYIVCGIAMGMPPCIGTLCIGAAPAAKPASHSVRRAVFDETRRPGSYFQPFLEQAVGLNPCAA